MNEIVQFADETQWLIQLDESYAAFKRSGWEFIAILRSGLDQFGWGDKRKQELIERASTQMDLQPSTLLSYYSVSKSESSRTAEALGLSFQHARSVYGLDNSLANSLLHDAAEWQWEPTKLSREAWITKNTNFTHVKNRLDPMPAEEVDEPEPKDIPPSRQSDTRALHELVSSVNRDKVFTYTGAQALPIAMTPKEHYAMAVYGRATGDMINWTRGDHYNRMLRDAKLKGRREGWTQEKLQAHVTDELAQLATDYQCSAVTILLNAATALAFSGTRQESAVIGYAHHELLRNSSSEEAADWLTRAERNRWTPEQLDAQMHPHRSNDDIIINIIKGVQGIQLDEQAITLTSAHGKLIITQWHIE